MNKTHTARAHAKQLLCMWLDNFSMSMSGSCHETSVPYYVQHRGQVGKSVLHLWQTCKAAEYATPPQELLMMCASLEMQ